MTWKTDWENQKKKEGAVNGDMIFENCIQQESKKVRISQCMIVKNEEKNIEQALSWGRDIMWEQVVVDTGSTDRTVELAKSMGAKVFYFQWIDDFAAAKNYALAQAGGDWIAFLDADEYMSKEDGEKLAGLLTELDETQYLAVMTTLNNIDENGRSLYCCSHTRFFRNGKNICYRGRVHESLIRNEKNLLVSEHFDACGDLTIYHTGYAPNVADQKQKSERNLVLLLQEMKDRPDDYSLMGYIGDTYRSEKKYDKAIEWYGRAVSSFPAPPPGGWPKEDTRTASTLVNYLSILCEHRKEESGKIEELYRWAFSYEPNESDLDWAMARWCADRGDYERACSHIERGLALLERDGNAFYGARLSADLMGTWELLAICYFNRGDLEKCVNCCTGLLKENRFSMGVLKVLLSAFRSDAMRYEKELEEMKANTELQGSSSAPAATGQQVLGFLGKLYNFEALKDRLFVLRGAKETEYAQLQEALRGIFSAEELALVENRITGSPEV